MIKKTGLLFLILSLFILPLETKAGVFDVDINIKKSSKIVEVEANLFTTIKVDGLKKETTPTYVLFKNNGNTSVSLLIEDIESSFETDFDYKPFSIYPYFDDYIWWDDLDEIQTKSNIAFGISNDGEEYLSILKNTEIDLGVLYKKSNDPNSGEMIYSKSENTNIYEIRMNSGYLWGDTKNLQFRITYVIDTDLGETDGDFTEKIYEFAEYRLDPLHIVSEAVVEGEGVVEGIFGYYSFSVDHGSAIHGQEDVTAGYLLCTMINPNNVIKYDSILPIKTEPSYMGSGVDIDVFYVVYDLSSYEFSQEGRYYLTCEHDITIDGTNHSYNILRSIVIGPEGLEKY